MTLQPSTFGLYQTRNAKEKKIQAFPHQTNSVLGNVNM